MENKIDYLALGSIVLLKKGIKKVIIVARGITAKINDEYVFFDYGATRYPEGIVGDQLAYFNHTEIAEVIFEGYADNDNQAIVDNINQYLAENKVNRKTIDELRTSGAGNGR